VDGTTFDQSGRGNGDGASGQNTYTGNPLGGTGRLPPAIPSILQGDPLPTDALDDNSLFQRDPATGEMRYAPAQADRVMAATEENPWRGKAMARRMSEEFARDLEDRPKAPALDPQLAATISQQIDQSTRGGTTTPTTAFGAPTEEQIAAMVEQLEAARGGEGIKINISDQPVIDALKGRVDRGEITQSESDSIFAKWKESNP
tara:strand:+ start:233 stop:841 length:609 start_codon:yes stop_codon:yes gene_type:complete